MHRRWPGMAAGLTLALLVAACTNQPDVTPDSSAPSSASSLVETTRPAPTIPEDGLLTDVGVDRDRGIIRIGLLSDLTGPTAQQNSISVAVQVAYWTALNDAGGIDGWQVEPLVHDTGLDGVQHRTAAAELRGQVVAFSQSAGTELTAAAADASDSHLVLPITHNSQWWDAGSVVLGHGTPYCLQALNVVGYASDRHTDTTESLASVAIVGGGSPDDLDRTAGARLAAAALGTPVAVDLEVDLTTDEGMTEAVGALAAAQPDLVLVAAPLETIVELWDESDLSESTWLAAGLTADLASGSDLAEVAPGFAGAFLATRAHPLWGGGNGESSSLAALLATHNPDLADSDVLIDGWVQASVMRVILQTALDEGDLTPLGVRQAARSIGSTPLDAPAAVRFDGVANQTVPRSVTIWSIDPAQEATEDEAASPASVRQVIAGYTHPAAAAQTFTGSCWEVAPDQG